MKRNIVIKMSSTTQISSSVKSNMLVEFPWLSDFYELGDAYLQVDSNAVKEDYDLMWVMPATIIGTVVTDYVCFFPKKNAYAQFGRNPSTREAHNKETFSSKYGTMKVVTIGKNLGLVIDDYQLMINV